MYILLCGEPPFQGKNEEEIFQKIKKCQYNFKPKEFNEVSNNCKDLIKKLLEPKKKKRIKASEALKHPFFSESFNPSRAMTENKDLSILEKLIKYKKKPSKFHETMYAFICNNYISIDEEKKLRAVFRYIDKEDKNALSKDALKKCLHEINIDLQDEEFNKIFKLLDANRTEYIEYQEFLRATCDKNALLTEENLKNAFLALGGGDEKECINGGDIKKFIFHDIIIKDSIFNEYLNQFGMKNDDTINFEQFCDMMKNDKKLNGESVDLDDSEEEQIRKKNSFNKKSKSNENEIVSEIRKIKTVNYKKMSIIDEEVEFGIENNKNKV
jgi:calcium-dependent protein kinase